MSLSSWEDIWKKVDAKIEANPTLRTTRNIINRFNDLRLSEAAASATYYLILGIFPLLIFIVSLSSSLGPSTWQQLTDLIQAEDMIPDPIMEYVRSLVNEITQSPTVSIASVGILGVLWAAGRAFSGVLLSLSDIYHVTLLQNGFLRRIFGVLLLVIVGLLTAVIVTFLSFGDWILSQISHLFNTNLSDYFELSWVGGVISFLLMIAVFSGSFYLASGRMGRFREAVGGGLFTSILLSVLSRVIVVFFDISGRATIIYGSLGTIILFLLWVYFINLFVLCGAFFHRELVIRTVIHGKLPGSVLPFPLMQSIERTQPKGVPNE